MRTRAYAIRFGAVPDLRAIYLETLTRCAPERLVQSLVRPDMPRNVVAIGKCAGPLLDGVAAVHTIDHAFAAIPRGYRATSVEAEVVYGGHPHIDDGSFEAGERLLAFVERHDDILFLISGGGSACVEVPLAPFSREEVIAANDELLRAGLPIAEMNAARRRYSAIKGGRLGARVRGRAVALIYSDVSTGRLGDVASGPALPEETQLIADNATLVHNAASIVAETATPHPPSAPSPRRRGEGSMPEVLLPSARGEGARSADEGPVVWEGQLECDVDQAARALFDRAQQLRVGEVLIAGGEPTVTIRGDGRGGRCSELAVRFALLAGDARFHALFAGSDGVDGNSGAAGIELTTGGPIDRKEAAAALDHSDTFPLAARLGRAIMIPPTGNNLRDLFLLARG